MTEEAPPLALWALTILVLGVIGLLVVGLSYAGVDLIAIFS